jgi:cytochrome c-type biogenesis protein CcmE
MDPARKRRVRLVVALTTALLLAGALVYTSVSASTEALKPSQLLTQARPGQSYQVTGKVVAGSIRHRGATTLFRVRDRNGTASVPVAYTGTVPDPFADNREVIVQVHKNAAGDGFVGERDTLVTKCPSKFSSKKY